jgi:tetratricopeptide (TPR) repeat protein
MRTVLAVLLLSMAVPALADDNNARKLVEDGWRAYKKHDLDRAEQLTRQALVGVGDYDVKGAALYNLGRVLEDRNDKAGAIAAYRESLGVRRNATVRTRLATLDAAAAASFDAFIPRPLQGPFANLEGYCEKVFAARPPESRAAAMADLCLRVIPVEPEKAFKLAAPVEEVKLIQIFLGDRLLIKLGGQLYVAELEPFPKHGGCHTDRLTFDGVTAHGAALEVSYQYEGSCFSRAMGSWYWHEQSSVIVGVGASKQPSAPPALRVELDETAGFGDAKVQEGMLHHVRKLTWRKDGSLDVAIVRATGQSVEEDVDDVEDIKGHHALAFP